MELEYSNANHTSRRRHLWLQLTLSIGFIFCLILGVGALSALFLLRTEPENQSGVSPLAILPTEGIAPQHALAQLMGDPPKALAYQALQAGELDLGYAITFFTVELSDSDRLALWLQIGRRYLATENTELGMRAYANARTIVVLSPSLTFNERSQALLQIAEDLVKVDAVNEALDAATQVKRLAEQTPDILPAQRSQLFESLRRVATQVGNTSTEAERFEAEIDAAARNPYLTPPGLLLVNQWASIAEPLAADPGVQEAMNLRHQAARALADRITHTGGIDIDPERQTLATALLNEDQARNAAFQRTLAAGLTLGQQFTLLQERRTWAALRLQIATGALGMSLVPEWEANVNTLQQELSAANNNLLVVVEALTTTQVDPLKQAMFRVETQLWVAQQTEIGLVADRTLADLSDQLRFLQSELVRLGAPLALPVAYNAEAHEPGFRILPFNALQ
jgi:hypothetical protein